MPGSRIRGTLVKLAYTRRVFSTVLPLVDREMARWEARASAIPDPELRRQALASQRSKRFHAEGGAVYALLAPGREPSLVRLIVALQTISDYLDNLCDRTRSLAGGDFRHLHRAMLDAVRPGAATTDYYALHPNGDDGGYLRALVETCQGELRSLPGYPSAEPEVCRLVGLYNDLQVYKHLEWPRRVPSLSLWFESHRHRYPELNWWEFAAAAGSTLAVFALFALSAEPAPGTRFGPLLDAYFPWICGLHILLDYFIDQAEDLAGGDLNLVSYYPDPRTREARLRWFLRQALAHAAVLPRAEFHQWVVQGLPGLYLSDVKVRRQGFEAAARELLRVGGPWSTFLYRVCQLKRAQAGG